MTSCIIHHSLLTSIPAPEKRDGERERERRRRRKEKGKKGNLPRYRGCFFSFLLKPWQNKTGLLPRLCRVTYKAS
jgi:hypothetical protein